MAHCAEAVTPQKPPYNSCLTSRQAAHITIHQDTQDLVLTHVTRPPRRLVKDTSFVIRYTTSKNPLAHTTQPCHGSHLIAEIAGAQDVVDPPRHQKTLEFFGKAGAAVGDVEIPDHQHQHLAEPGPTSLTAERGPGRRQSAEGAVGEGNVRNIHSSYIRSASIPHRFGRQEEPASAPDEAPCPRWVRSDLVGILTFPEGGSRQPGRG